MVVKLEWEMFRIGPNYWNRYRREVAYGKFPAHKSAPLLHGRGNRGRGRGLTDFGTCIGQAVVKVRFRVILGDYGLYLLRVVDLPDDGLPTSPMRGSRGIARSSQVIPAQKLWIARRVPAWGWKKLSVRSRDLVSSFAGRCSCCKYFFAMNLF